MEIRDLYNTLAEHSFQQPYRGLHGGSWLAAACDPQHIGQSVRPETTLLQPTGLNQGCIPSLLKRYAATGQPDESCLGTNMGDNPAAGQRARLHTQWLFLGPKLEDIGGTYHIGPV